MVTVHQVFPKNTNNPAHRGDTSPRLLLAFKWSVASEFASKAIQPLVFVVLAWLLTPEDFGLMAAVMMVVGFSQIFWEAGMGKGLIQRQSDLEDAANAAFWINIGLGMVVALILFLVAGWVADLIFHDLRIKVVLQVMTLNIFLGAVSSVHTALLQKDMQFNRLFWIRFATIGLPGLASIPLAWAGLGYWALVIGMLAGQAVQVVMLWRVSTWRPGIHFNTKVAGEMARFGAWVGLSGLLSWFFMWADSLVVGIYLGSHELGLYRTGSQFVSLFYALLFAPLIPVLYSHFSEMNAEKERLSRALAKVIKVLALTAIPIAFLVFSLREPLETLIFSHEWQGIGLIIGVMALTHGFAWTIGANGEVYRAMGKPAYETIITAPSLVVYLVAYVISINMGFEIFVWTRFGLAVAAVLLHLYVAHKLIGLSLQVVVRSVLLITLLSSFAIVVARWLSWASDSLLIQLIAGSGCSILVVGSLLLLLERKGVVRDVRMLLGRRIP